MKLERIMIGLTVAVAVFGVGAAVFAARANAADGDSSPYMNWRPLKTLGTLCVNYPASGGWYKPVSDATNAWNSTDANLVRRDNCAASGYSKQATLYFKAVSTTETNWCARTVPTAGWGNQTVARLGQAPLSGIFVTAYGMTIEFNWNPKVTSACRGTTAKVTHLVAHEQGHWLGLDHDAGDVMHSGTSWNYTLPGATSKRQMSLYW